MDLMIDKWMSIFPCVGIYISIYPHIVNFEVLGIKCGLCGY